jgi:hypothetical protein
MGKKAIIKNGFVRDEDGDWFNLNKIKYFSAYHYVVAWFENSEERLILSGPYETAEEAQAALDEAIEKMGERG